jgi:hypothetical protein
MSFPTFMYFFMEKFVSRKNKSLKERSSKTLGNFFAPREYGQ